MTQVTTENLHGAVKSIKGDWKAVASLIMALLIFLGVAFWGITGYVVRAADTTIRENTERVIVLEAHQILVDSQIANNEERQKEILNEIRDMKSKVSNVAESQARLEGAILGRK